MVILRYAVILCYLIIIQIGEIMNWFFGKKEVSEDEKFKTESPASPSQKEVLFRLKKSGQYTAVSISRCGCSTASQLIGKLFSFQDVPSLPLQECTASKCTCEYQGISERRHKDRRAAERRESLRMEEDRRKESGRRKEDKLWNMNNF